MKLETLRKRREFLRVRGGGRWATPAFVLETKQRPPVDADTPQQPPAGTGPRFGFTVTKRMGNAVRRNRIRRRLRAALQEVAQSRARDHFDYVVIARMPAHDIAFTELTGLMTTAFERVHRPGAQSGRQRRNRPKSKDGSDKNRSTTKGSRENKPPAVTR